MSVFATAWAYEQRIRNSGAKFVLVALADFADANGYCYPGQRTLAGMTSLNQRTVRAHLGWLEAHGFIRRSRAHDDRGRRTSDDIHLLAPPERLRPAVGQAEKSPAQPDAYRRKTARAYRKNSSPAKSPANPSEEEVEPSDAEPTEAQPAASPPGRGGARAAANSDHRAGMDYLAAACGPIPDPKAQGGALKWLLEHYPLEQCCRCLDALLAEEWREARVSWQTVKKEIGTWLARKEKSDARIKRPRADGDGNKPEAGARRTGRLDRIEQAYAGRDYERLVDEGL